MLPSDESDNENCQVTSQPQLDVILDETATSSANILKTWKDKVKSNLQRTLNNLSLLRSKLLQMSSQLVSETGGAVREMKMPTQKLRKLCVLLTPVRSSQRNILYKIDGNNLSNGTINDCNTVMSVLLQSRFINDCNTDMSVLLQSRFI